MFAIYYSMYVMSLFTVVASTFINSSGSYAFDRTTMHRKMCPRAHGHTCVCDERVVVNDVTR